MQYCTVLVLCDWFVIPCTNQRNSFGDVAMTKHTSRQFFFWVFAWFVLPLEPSKVGDQCHFGTKVVVAYNRCVFTNMNASITRESWHKIRFWTYDFYKTIKKNHFRSCIYTASAQYWSTVTVQERLHCSRKNLPIERWHKSVKADFYSVEFSEWTAFDTIKCLSSVKFFSNSKQHFHT